MLRGRAVFPVVALFVMGALAGPLRAANEVQKKDTPPCGCGQQAVQKPADRAGCVCRLFKTGDFGGTCSYYAMFCPPTGAYSWGPYTCPCGTAQYSGCSNTPTMNCPPANCVAARKPAGDDGVDPSVPQNGVEIGADNWEPIADGNHANYRLKKTVPPIFAMVEFHSGQKLRVKLWQVQATPKKPVPPGDVTPPEKVFSSGRQVGSNGAVDETILKDKIRYVTAPGATQTKATFVTAKNGAEYLLLLKEAVPVPKP